MPWQEIPRNSQEWEIITGLIKEGFLKGCDFFSYLKLVVQIARGDN